MQLRLKMPLDIVKYSRQVQIIFQLGAYRGHKAPNLNLGPPNISESTRDRKLKLKTQLDVTKYSL